MQGVGVCLLAMVCAAAPACSRSAGDAEPVAHAASAPTEAFDVAARFVAELHEDSTPRLELSEAPPLVSVPAVVAEPLAFQGFAPPYDDPAVPASVREAFLTHTRALVENQPGDWVRSRGAEWLELDLARAELPTGVEVWVHHIRDPALSSWRRADLRLRDPGSGRLSAQSLRLETRWNDSEVEALPAMLGHADLDLDGVSELVVRSQSHSGTDIWDIDLHWFAVDEDLWLTRLLIQPVDSNISYRGWDGSFMTRVLPASPYELHVQAWYAPRDGGAGVGLGHSVYARASRRQPFELVYEVVDPDAPGDEGHGAASRGQGSSHEVVLERPPR